MKTRHFTCKIMFILLFLAIPILGQGTTYVTMNVGEEKVFYFPTSVTSKNLKPGSIYCYSNAPSYVKVSYYTDFSVCVKVIKAFSSPVIIYCSYQYFLPTNQLANGYYDYSITISSTVKPTKITLPASITMEEGTIQTLKPTVTPENAEYTLTWTSNSPYIPVSKNGTVSADYPGYATITVRTDNNLSASCKVTVTERKRIEMKSSLTLYTGDTYTLSPKVYPSNAQYTLTWISSNNSIAKVEDGNVTAINPGNATITAETNIGLKASCKVTVLRKFSDGDYFTSLTKEGAEIRFRVINTKERTCEVCYAVKYESWENLKGEITIPSNPEGMKVVKISDSAFEYSKITKVSIPNSVTSIGEAAFAHCDSLTSVAIPNSVTAIGRAAFRNCSELNTVEIPNSVTSIGSDAFYETAWYNNQPDGVVYAGKIAYKYKGVMPENTIIELKDGTLGIAGGAFQDCAKMITVTIPHSVTNIGERAFSGCSKLLRIQIPSSVTTIGPRAFADCWRLINIYVDPNNEIFDSRDNCNAIIESKSNKLIVGCKTTKIPSTVTTLGAYCFYECMGLKTIEIPNSVSVIESYAFFNSDYLSSIVLPNSITSIGSYAFAYTNLTSVDIPNSVQELGQGVFSVCSYLKSVNLPAGLSEIPNCAFEDCANLSSIVIPNGVKKIGGNAFSGCNRLISIVIPNSVETIGWAFESCLNLEDVRIEDIAAWCKIEFGGEKANPLYYARHLYVNDEEVVDMVIPETVTTIGENAFSYFKGIKSASIGNSVTSIGKEAFWYCTGLTSVSIGENVEDIADGAFYRSCNLTKIISHIRDPYVIQRVFGDMNYEPRVKLFSSATLYVPYGKKSKYEATEGWKDFQNIVEMDIPPISEGKTIDFSKNSSEEMDLDGQVVDNVYYSVSSKEGGYNANEGCIEVIKSTDDEVMDGVEINDLFDGEFNNQFAGIIFKVPSGKGNIYITGETTGDMSMKVKIGDKEPISVQMVSKSQVSIPYTMTEDTFVYLYGGVIDAGTKDMKKAQSIDGVLKIYSIAVAHDTDGIEETHLDAVGDSIIYSISGKRVDTPKHGINIIRKSDGAVRKIVIK